MNHTWERAVPGQPCQGPRCMARGIFALTIKGASSRVEIYCDTCARQVAGQLGLEQPAVAPGYVVYKLDAPEQLAHASAPGAILFSAEEAPWIYPKVDAALRTRALAEQYGVRAGVRPHPQEPK